MRTVSLIIFFLFPVLAIFGQDSSKRGSLIYECDDTGEDGIIFNPDSPSKFAGGDTALWMFVKKNLIIPIDSKFSSRKIILNVGINIDSTGQVTKIATTDWETEEWKALGNNVVAAFKKMPRWVPRTSFDKLVHYPDYRVVVVIVQKGILTMRFNSKLFY